MSKLRAGLCLSIIFKVGTGDNIAQPKGHHFHHHYCCYVGMIYLCHFCTYYYYEKQVLIVDFNKNKLKILSS